MIKLNDWTTKLHFLKNCATVRSIRICVKTANSGLLKKHLKKEEIAHHSSKLPLRNRFYMIKKQYPFRARAIKDTAFFSLLHFFFDVDAGENDKRRERQQK